MRTYEQLLCDMTPEEAYDFAVLVTDHPGPIDQLYRFHREIQGNYSEWRTIKKQRGVS